MKYGQGPECEPQSVQTCLGDYWGDIFCCLNECMYVSSLLTVLVALSLVHDFAFQCLLLLLDKKISRDKNFLLEFLRALGISFDLQPAGQ